MKYRTFRGLVIGGALGIAAGGVFLLTRPSPAKVAPPAAVEAVAVAAPPPAPTAPPVAARPEHAAFLVSKLGQPAKGDKIKDALGSRQVKVNVYAEGGRWARAKVDLDRDEKWDEKWWLEDGVPVRAVAPADDEKYGAPEKM
jgi:hypothetical protein